MSDLPEVKFTAEELVEIAKPAEEQECPGCATLRAHIAELERWEDLPLPEDDAIGAAFPTRSGRHETYAEAMRMVGARRSKGELVALVNWLLVRIADRDHEAIMRSANLTPDGFTVIDPSRPAGGIFSLKR